MNKKINIIEHNLPNRVDDIILTQTTGQKVIYFLGGVIYLALVRLA